VELASCKLEHVEPRMNMKRTDQKPNWSSRPRTSVNRQVNTFMASSNWVVYPNHGSWV